jgi:inner membrane protein
MVDVLGHFAVSLLWAIPAWFAWERRRTLVFIGLVLLAAMVPDVDLYVPWLAHHGPTHTVLFVVTVGVVGGAVATRAAAWWPGRSGGSQGTRPTLYAFSTVAFLVGGLSHVFIDLLSNSAAGQPLDPFWPFFEKPFHLYVIHHFSAPVWNGFLLLGAITVHLFLFVLEPAPALRGSSTRDG